MKKVNLNLKDTPKLAKEFVGKARPYLLYAVIAIVLCSYAFMLLSIKSIAVSEPTEEAIAERLSQVKQPKVDEETVAKLEQLKDQNIQVQALFDEARKNPFEE
jgi:hypothetical protein